MLNDQEEYFDESRDGETGYGEKDILIHLMTSQAWRCLILLLTLSKMFLPKMEPGFGGMAGQEYLKQELHELYLHLDLDNETLQRFDIKPTGSVLLYGPPGCGKSYAVSHLPYEFDIDIIPFDWNRIPATTRV